jgi:putative ABC transport system ATP-binding protein
MIAGTNRTLVFKARNLSKSYRLGQVTIPALRGVDLDLYEHELVVLLGPSGSGKTTLLNILGGLDSADSGEVFYRDHDLVRASESDLTRFRREHVGFIFQFYNLIPSLTALENIRLVTEISPSPMRPETALDLVGMDQLGDRFPSQLSGGEQQRVSIARAISKRPDILLCDEPTGALDCETGRKVLEAILKVHRELGTLVVIITHNAAISGMADRVIRIENGRIGDVSSSIAKVPLSEIRW